MDLDPSDNNFYDGMPPFIPNESLDEFLRFTDNELDTAIGTFAAPHGFNDFDVPMLDNILDPNELTLQPSLYHPDPNRADDFKFDLWPSSPPTTTTPMSTAFAPSTASSTSSSSSSSSASASPHSGDDELQFNPDMFMSFLNEDDCKLGELTQENITNMPQRNTPSPTGSYVSSSGSSTSGVHSDASSSAFTDSYAESKASLPCKEESLDGPASNEDGQVEFIAPTAPVTISAAAPYTPATQSPILVAPGSNILMPTAIKLEAMPIVTANSRTTTSTTAAATVKIEPSPLTVGKTGVKIITPSASAQQATSTGTKIASPTNSKPKTIFLSSNDFKTLMQKMNSNGGKGAKISGGLNGQMPKIIMKTANGKVVTANKPTILNVSNANAVTASAAGAQKFIKAPLVIKQQHHQQHQPQHHQTTRVLTASGLSGPSRASLSSSGNCSSSSSSCSSSGGPDISIYKGFMDEKMFKKQQRMIKNRESASLSRKKKKEYVVSLESRINDLEKENYTLKGENTSLRSQLVAYAQTCHCKHTNVSEFILNSLNMKVNNSLAVAGASCSTSGGHHHVKIAPKPIGGKSIKQRMTAATVKKNVAVLFAMAFMVTLNVGSFQTYFNKNSLENAMETVTVEEAAPPLATANAVNGRRLLWVESETEFNEKLNRSKREAELEVPPLHFLRPVNRTGANALAAAEQHGKRSDPTLTATKCDDVPLATNQTEENMRLAKKLHKWIDGNDYLNLSLHEKFDNDLKNPGGFKLTPDYLKLKPIDLPMQQGQKRKYYIQRATDYGNDLNDNKQRKLDGNGGPTVNGQRNSLELFKPQLSEEYLRLFRGIKRQEDTFYVLSFNMDHILLPASAYNKSSRPKMSLMLPAGDPSLNGDIVLMQIDCEVVNTTELKLKSDMIPEKLKPNKYAGNVHVQPNVANNQTRAGQRQPAQTQEREKKMPLRGVGGGSTEQFKHKPPIRTYFMMGPRTQAGLKNRTKLNAIKLGEHTEAVYSAGVANSIDLDEEQPKRQRFDMGNSSLFTRMRETIEGDTSNSKTEDF